MAFPASKRAHSRKVDTELNLTPIMNVFVILIPFLLLTAVFAQTAVLNLSLPSGEGQDEESNAAVEENAPKLVISITDSGVIIGAVGGFLPEIPLNDKGHYDFATVESKLKEIKEKFPEQKSAVIVSEPEILYENIISIMDSCIKCGFEDISLARGIITSGEAQ